MPKIETTGGSTLEEGREPGAETPASAAQAGVPPAPQGADKREELVNLLSSRAVLRLARRWSSAELSEDVATIHERVVAEFLKMLRAHGVTELGVDVFSDGDSGWMKFAFGDRVVHIFYSELPRYAKYLLRNIARFLHDTCQYTHRYADKRSLRSVAELMVCSEAYGVDNISVVLRQRRRRAGRKAGGVAEG
jgi:hypothetical protein